MKLTAHSRKRLMQTFANWDVPRDFADPMYNYLVHGFSPGSCFTAMLANDFHRAIRSSHPGNHMEAFKSLSGWICDTVPEEALGSYEKVDAWCGRITPDQRRIILEDCGLIYTSKEEVMLILKDEHTVEPHLY